MMSFRVKSSFVMRSLKNLGLMLSLSMAWIIENIYKTTDLLPNNHEQYIQLYNKNNNT